MRLRVRVPSVLVKMECVLNSLGQGTHCELSCGNSYETRIADPGYDGWLWSELADTAILLSSCGCSSPWLMVYRGMACL